MTDPSAGERLAGPGAARGDVRYAILVAAAAAVLTAAMAFPVLLHPASRIFGSELVGRQHDPFTVMAQWQAPVRLGMTTQPATDLPGAALARLAGPVGAYNAMVLITFPAAAFFACLLALELGTGRTAAMFAGLAFAFSVHHVAHSAYHPHIAQVQWIPAYFLALFRCLRRCSAGRALWLVLACGAVSLGNFYAGLIVGLLTPVVLAAHVAAARRVDRDARRTLLVLGALVAAGIGYAALVAPSVLTGEVGATFAFPRQAVVDHSARWWAYLVPPVDHALFGRWSASLFVTYGAGAGLVEQQLSVGWSVLALSVAGLIMGVRHEAATVRRAVLMLAVLGAAALVSSLPPGQRVGPLTLPVPAAWLHDPLPMFRAYARFGVVVALVGAVLGGLGLAHGLASRRRSRRLAAWLCAALAVVELLPLPWRWRDVLPTAGHRYVAGLAGQVRALDSAPVSAQDVLLSQLVGHDLEFASGEVADWLERGLPARLAARGVTHVVYRRSPRPRCGLPDSAAPPGLTPVARFSDSTVFAVDAPPADILVRQLGGFDVCERDAEMKSWRWMSHRGEWQVENRSPLARESHLWVKLQSFAFPRRLVVEVNAERAATLDVAVAPAWYRIPAIRLRSGTNVVRFAPDGPPTVADEVLHNGDSRALSIAVWDWAWGDLPPQETLP